MLLAKTRSVEELQVISRFEGLRQILLSDPYAEHLDKPLAYWALPTDRRLPLAFLGRPLRDLLNANFHELSSTPGIGRKKMACFVQLLGRAADTDPSELPAEIFHAEKSAAAGSEPATSPDAESPRFDPTNITEVTWAQWRAAVVRHQLAGEKLGCFAPTLQNMTRVIWNVPLGEYTDATLAEIREMKTHGEKRVSAILEAFHAAYSIVATMGSQHHLAVRIVPRLIDGVERWTERALQRAGIPSTDTIAANYVLPLLEQIRIDAPQQVVALAEKRLGVSAPMSSVRQAARNMGLTRARVYQLLNEINDIMSVRWPMGRHQSHELLAKFRQEAMDDNPERLQQFYAAVELFYPGNRRGAAGPIEQIDAMEAEMDDEVDSEVVPVERELVEVT